MSSTIAFNQVDLIVGDMDAAIAFSRQLGVDLAPSAEEWPPGSGARHVHAHPRGRRRLRPRQPAHGAPAGPRGAGVEVTDGTWRYNASHYRISASYDLAKVAVNRLAFSLGHERWNQQSVTSAQLAAEYGFSDVDGSRPDVWRYDEVVASGARPVSPDDDR